MRLDATRAERGDRESLHHEIGHTAHVERELELIGDVGQRSFDGDRGSKLGRRTTRAQRNPWDVGSSNQRS